MVAGGAGSEILRATIRFITESADGFMDKVRNIKMEQEESQLRSLEVFVENFAGT